jgi:hypothetical protein
MSDKSSALFTSGLSKPDTTQVPLNDLCQAFILFEKFALDHWKNQRSFSNFFRFLKSFRADKQVLFVRVLRDPKRGQKGKSYEFEFQNFKS